MRGSGKTGPRALHRSTIASDAAQSNCVKETVGMVQRFYNLIVCVVEISRTINLPVARRTTLNIRYGTHKRN